ncbi:MAG: rRNA (guanine527-N7)-methyltransferase [Thermotogaceae bacterium]|jgi:16S rRNA (guanine527-N7)-methyltransferase|nr:rRNA (guanine527-N7)-methyltransferase [Thermotogaceae bacterium]MDN5337207.1 rRNA (guanine527-N7)-methyltransferase [Thermotogaceae bacterium]
MNLVSFPEAEFFLEIVVDSITPWLAGIIKNQKDKKILDIGTGAGIPGIPLAIVLDRISFHLLDSKKKKIDFVHQVKQELKLSNVETHCERVEVFALKNLRSFDMVVSRAVGEIVVLLEYAAPLLKLGGKLILYKGEKTVEELEKARKAIDLLGFNEPDIFKYELNEQKRRTLLVFSKIFETPEGFPRKPGMATKKPLVK